LSLQGFLMSTITVDNRRHESFFSLRSSFNPSSTE
jgi:hypothetical protein